ncbi:response regulator transcription factor [Sediminibacterium ginsengisoli]|uniref:Response regulator receiver domain-containing protein n=1 Tax=Sediminibacterium ginsengisoli TaxID=413434 RepID=A0A1T4RM87_9BACT|nr:response regulator [Sediminibacterium ginsengisoli]SKA17104.1 Response regulator receiver domain-containing protein [Sediminibacterium ginsengisoli]
MHNEKADRINILVVEDDVFMQSVLKGFLGKNYNVWVCSDGIDALTFIQEGNIPGLIISDLNTPKLNGLDFMIQLKSGAFFEHIPVVILSSEDQSEIRIKCFEAGADDYVVKPFNPRELEARLKVILKRNRISNL